MERRCRIDYHLEEKPWTLYPDSGICSANQKRGGKCVCEDEMADGHEVVASTERQDI
jgi:hypothetical protein